MKEKTITTVLWIVYGFVLIQACDSVIYSITQIALIGHLALGVSYGLMNFTMPLMIIVFYLLTTSFLLKKARQISDRISPVVFLVTIAIFALARFGRSFLWDFSRPADYGYPESLSAESNFLEIYGNLHVIQSISLWTSIILVAMVSYRKLKKLDA
ncbi:hypothetical protein [Halocola ammonii]